MNPTLNLSSASGALAVDDVPASFALQRESDKYVTRAKTVRHILPSAWRPAKLVEGIAAVITAFYLLGAIALSGALLFYTFSR
jgi:hypothetical protein